MKASLFLAKYLEKRGVTHIFELIGGMITHLIDSVDKSTNIEIISCHHEQSAGFAAEGFSRVKGIPGIAFATSGPGATNLITAIGSCYFDSVPAVFITGQVNTYELKEQKEIRQLGFQETDIVSIVKPLCKDVFQVKKSSDLPFFLDKAYQLSLEGRNGPCLLDIPMNVQSADISDELVEKFFKEINTGKKIFTSKQLTSEKEILEKLLLLKNQLFKSKRPLILAGGGCSSFNNRVCSRKIIENLNLPTVFSLMGVDILPYHHKQRVGFIGSYGNRWANKLLGESDFLIALGTRLDIKQTGNDIKSFSNKKIIWQIDIDKNEIGVRVKPDNYIITSLNNLEDVIKKADFKLNSGNKNWNQRIDSIRKSYPAIMEYKAKENEINPIELIDNLSSYPKSSSIYVTDVGQHQMWSAQSLKLGLNDRFITSGGMGAMGFGLPAAIGAYFANPNNNLILITGDGSLQLNIQELETIKRNKIPIKIVLLNNNCHGMVRQFQESYFNKNYQSTIKGYSAPNFQKLVNAY